METVKETSLTIFANLVGDKFLETLVSTIYESGFFQIAMGLAAFAAFLKLGFDIHSKQIPRKFIYYLVVLTLVQPYKGKPVGFVVIDSMSRLVAANLEQATLKFASNTGNPKTATNMHPGLAMEMLVSAATAKIESAETRNRLARFMAKCFESSLKRDGNPAEFNDLFNFETSYTRDLVGNTVATFAEKSLDERSLRNNTSYSDVESGKNCYDALNTVRREFVGELEKQPLVVTEKVLNPSTDDSSKLATTAEWYKNWQRTNPSYLNVAQNLRLAVAGEHAKSEIIQKYGIDNAYYESTNMDASLREFMLSTDSNAVSAGFAASNLKEIGSRVAGNRWAFSLGASIKDLKEKIELMPYYIVTVKNFLKIVSVLAILSLLTGRIQIFTTWAGAWFIVTIMPAIINSTRSLHNSIITSKLGIQDFINSAATGNKALAYGVDFSQSKALLDEFIPLAYTMINQEIMFIGFLSTLILAGSWMAGLAGNGHVGWMSGSIQGQLTGGAVSQATGGMGGFVDKMTGDKKNSQNNNQNSQTHFPRENLRPAQPMADMSTNTNFPRQEQSSEGLV